MTSCHSRGEQSFRQGTDGYNRRSYQIQSQYQSSAYPINYQSQSQSLVNSQHASSPIVQPEFYPQYQNRQPSYSPYLAPSPAFISSPQPAYNSPNPQTYIAPNYQNYPPKKVYSNSQPNLDSRIDGDTSTTPSEDLTTRRPPKGSKRPATTRKPPPQLLDTRFDDRTNVAFKKFLSYDSQLSDNMEIFSLALLDQFCLKAPEGNFMISPFAVYHMLVLIAEGANGNTYEEINKNLNLVSISKTRDFQQYLNEALK